MKFRFMAARCCCGPGPTPGCDPITGAQDNFETLDTVKWTFAYALGSTIEINPVGTLSASLAGFEPWFQATRCAIYDTRWDEPPSLTRSDNATWQITGTWTLKPGFLIVNQEWQGPGVFAIFPGTPNKVYALQRGIGFTDGIGWRHRIWFSEPGLATPYVLDLPEVIQAAFNPYPTGPFSADVDLRIDRLRIGTDAGKWTAAAYIDATNIFNLRNIATPSTSETNWDHGFNVPITSAVDTLKVTSWIYLA